MQASEAMQCQTNSILESTHEKAAGLYRHRVQISKQGGLRLTLGEESLAGSRANRISRVVRVLPRCGARRGGGIASGRSGESAERREWDVFLLPTEWRAPAGSWDRLLEGNFDDEVFDDEVDNGVARVRGVEGEFRCFSTFRPQHTASVVGRVREAVARLTVVRRKTACIQCSILSLGRRCSASCDAVNDRAKSQSSVTCDMEARVSLITPRMHFFSDTRRQLQHVALTVTEYGGRCKHKRESHFDSLGEKILIFVPSSRGGPGGHREGRFCVQVLGLCLMRTKSFVVGLIFSALSSAAVSPSPVPPRRDVENCAAAALVFVPRGDLWILDYSPRVGIGTSRLDSLCP